MIQWASDLWPYVNGKALWNKLNLTEMEASDMLDVLHFLFEEDFTATSEDHARSRSGLRDSIYNDMYGVSYPYKMKPPKNGTGVKRSNPDLPMDFEDDLSSAQPFNPRTDDKSRSSSPSKPSKTEYVPADSVPAGAQNLQGLNLLN